LLVKNNPSIAARVLIDGVNCHQPEVIFEGKNVIPKIAIVFCWLFGCFFIFIVIPWKCLFIVIGVVISLILSCFVLNVLVCHIQVKFAFLNVYHCEILLPKIDAFLRLKHFYQR